MTTRLTDTQRINYAVEHLQSWQANLRENAEHARKDSWNPDSVRAARAAETRANDMRDIIAMLDGSDDASIALFLSSRGLS